MEGSNGPGDGKPQVARRLRTSAAREWYAHPQTWMSTSKEVQKWPFKEERGKTSRPREPPTSQYRLRRIVLARHARRIPPRHSCSSSDS